MKSIKTQLMEALAVNEAKEFDFDEFDKQVQKVDKFFKNKSQLNKWATGELGAPIEDYIFDGIKQIMEYLEGWQDVCWDYWENDEEEFEKKYKAYDNVKFVEYVWSEYWDGLSHVLHQNAGPVSDVFDEMWSYCTKTNFPFAF